MAATDTELLTRSRARDSQAFAQLIDRHKDQMVNYLARLTGCRDRAEDIAQETFVRFYKQLHHYREEGTLSAYLFRIATNLVRTEERRKRRWRLLQPILATSGFASNGHHSPASPQADALATEEHRQVTRALSTLDVIYRAPLVLREIEGLPYQEIAGVLACSEGTVKSRLHRGRQLLKQKLTPYWNGGRPAS
ncbi:MAG: sigma-70 family RNA polymerase sigma factor [bacterium]|nr:sigma-70 family RNA polymerase sigma factor [bacterium]